MANRTAKALRNQYGKLLSKRTALRSGLSGQEIKSGIKSFGELGNPPDLSSLSSTLEMETAIMDVRQDIAILRKITDRCRS